MASKDLREYERKRDFSKTPEPAAKSKSKPKKPKAAKPAASGRFVVQEHHARRLHWDLRLEHDGVALSWALPKGVPQHPSENRLAVQTEDHPLKYLEFEGKIPKGEYGAGTMSIWDHGTYEAEKMRNDEVILTFAGERVQGRYALFQTKGKDWMIHRMDPPADPGREPIPDRVKPMMATLSTLPKDESGWGFEIKWDGVRAVAYCDGGSVRLESRSLRDISSQYPEVRRIGDALGSVQVILDGEIVAFDDEGRPDFQRLQGRMHLASDAAVRRRMNGTPATYVIFDLLFLEGRPTVELPYEERRSLLERLELAGESWQTPAYHRGDGAALLKLTRERGLEGIVAKRLGSPYTPGKRTRTWLKIKHTTEQELVIGGWMPGEGRRSGTLGALLVGYYEGAPGERVLRYAGRVGTGFTEATLRDLIKKLKPLATAKSPFDGRQPAKAANFVKPKLVAQVEFREWTRTRTLRAPSFKGLRDDKDPLDVGFEAPEPPP